MISLFRRVRDAFRAGKAEERFRELESQTRLLLGELEHSLEKDALRRATAARRLSRERAAAAEGEEVTIAPPPAEPEPGDRKAAIRRRLAQQGTLMHRISHRAGGEE